jgi:hypothetical protein
MNSIEARRIVREEPLLIDDSSTKDEISRLLEAHWFHYSTKVLLLGEIEAEKFTDKFPDSPNKQRVEDAATEAIDRILSRRGLRPNVKEGIQV